MLTHIVLVATDEGLQSRGGESGALSIISLLLRCVWGAKERVGIQLDGEEGKKGVGKDCRGALMRLLPPKTWFATYLICKMTMLRWVW